MNRREFLRDSSLALGWLGLASAAPAGEVEHEALAGPIPPDQVTADMRRNRPRKLAYRNPGLVTDAGVGLWGWPLPMDYDGDGRMDLVVAGTGTPSNGVYFFRNTGEVDIATKLPLFARGERLGSAVDSPQISYTASGPIVTTPGAWYPDFRQTAFAHPVPLPAPSAQEILGKNVANGIAGIRANEWTLVDYFGTGKLDLVVGIDFWGDYQWENAFHGSNASDFDAAGRWRFGPLRGYVYILRNLGTNEHPSYAPPAQLQAGGAPVDVYGRPSPCFGDFRGVGKLDLICGEFIDGFTYFENVGTRTEPRYAAGRKLTVAGEPLTMDLCMISPVACDFNGDGRLDLVVAQEDGRVAFIENTGAVIDQVPQFLPPRFFRQEADKVKFGVLSAPAAYDLDGDGNEDLVVGDSAGYIGLIRNLGGNPPRWAEPVYLAGGKDTIRIQAGYNGDCQGPSEAKWGYTNVSVADWDGDGLPDILCADVYGRVRWYRNIGTRRRPRFATAQPIEVEWEGPAPKPPWNWWNPVGKELVTQWRCTPLAFDWNRDGLMDLITLDCDGYLALFERRRRADGTLELLPPKRVFWGENVSAYDQSGRPLNHGPGLLRLNAGLGGASGRRTFCITDWDGDGALDILVNSVNISWLRGLGRNEAGHWVFRDMGPLSDDRLAGHSTCPTIVHWGPGANGDLLFGAEDGFLYHLPRPANRVS